MNNNKIKSTSIKAVSIVFGTAYFISKSISENIMKAEAKIICKIDDNYTESEVAAHRNNNYHEVKKLIKEKVEEACDAAEVISKKITNRNIAQQITLMDQSSIKC